MQKIKKFVSVLFRLIVIDGLILVTTWLENMSRETRKILSTFSLRDFSNEETVETFVTAKELETRLADITDVFAAIQAENDKYLRLDFKSVKDELAELVAANYEVEEMNVEEFIDARQLAQ